METLIQCGADLDRRGWRPNMTAREMAREHYEQMPDDAERRPIAELCELNPAVILTARDARPASPPQVHPMFELALELAADDASRLVFTDVRPENLLVGLGAMR